LPGRCASDTRNLEKDLERIPMCFFVLLARLGVPSHHCPRDIRSQDHGSKAYQSGLMVKSAMLLRSIGFERSLRWELERQEWMFHLPGSWILPVRYLSKASMLHKFAFE